MSVTAASHADARRTRALGDLRRVVVKVGSAVITGKDRLRARVIEDLAYDIVVLLHRGYQVVMVVSGAVAGGFSALGLADPPIEVVARQASACVGQYKLMARMAKAFNKHRCQVAQLLMMAEDIEDRRRFLSARHTLQMLLGQHIVPIINENDPLADDENKIGDNDHLAALVTNVVSADLLVILSTVEGLYRHGETGAVISEVDAGSSIVQHVTDERSASGVGGMAAKVSAAQLASKWGVPTIIADGTARGLLPRLVTGEEVGTLFKPLPSTLEQRKRWIAFRVRSHGAIRVARSASDAIRRGRGGLLPSAVVAVQGRFSMGARVDIEDEGGTVFAVGLASYSANETRQMKGREATEFKKVLGYEYVREIVAREDMVVLSDANGHAHPE